MASILYDLFHAIWYFPTDDSRPPSPNSRITPTTPDSPGRWLRPASHLRKPRRLVDSPTESHRPPPPRAQKPSPSQLVLRNCPLCHREIKVNLTTSRVTVGKKGKKRSDKQYVTVYDDGEDYRVEHWSPGEFRKVQHY